jgi:hypothetical protein
MRTLSVLAAILLSVSAQAQSLDDVVSSVMKEYGGAAAWQKVTSLRESGTVVPVMRKGDGQMTRMWKKDASLRIEIVYPTDREVRVLDGDHGTRNDKEVTGASLDAMRLQAGRLALPYLLVSHRATLRDLGMVEGLRVVEIPLSSGLALTVSIDPKTWHIVRSSGKASGLEFVVDYSDFRRVGTLLFPFAEAGTAQGMPTANTKIDAIAVNPAADSVPAAAAH